MANKKKSPGNASLNQAAEAQNDEFYTQLTDIAAEVEHYKAHFAGKTVLCNCDDPRKSQFFHYFQQRFEGLGLKRLITTCYKNRNADIFSEHKSERAVYLVYEGDKNGNRQIDADELQVLPLKGDGDFRSAECIEFLRQADIVVTNPPFSLFREYVAQLVKYNKKFLILGNPNSITYKDIFPHIKDNKLWVGYKSMKTDMLFDVPEHVAKRLVAEGKKGSSYKVVDGVVKGRTQAIWFTNLPHNKRTEQLIIDHNHYAGNEAKYPKYDNYDAIEVGKVENIPGDYFGVMGVPITFLDKYNPEQFEIVSSDYEIKQGAMPEIIRPGWTGKIDRGYVNGKRKYARLLIRRR